MKKHCVIILTILTVNFIPVYGQETKDYFDKIVTVLKSEKNSIIISKRLDSLKSKYIPSRSNLNDYFDRDIDFGYHHQRIKLEINFDRFQIDFLKKNDTILLTSLKTDGYKKLKFSQVDTSKATLYLKDRNKFYKSSKTIHKLIDELSLDEVFAFYCGDGSPKTERGLEIEKLVEDRNIEVLQEMLKSICIEIQAYGVAGSEMLVRQGYTLPTDINKIIKYIKERNSEAIICSGCLVGLVQKLYNMNHNEK